MLFVQLPTLYPFSSLSTFFNHTFCNECDWSDWNGVLRMNEGKTHNDSGMGSSILQRDIKKEAKRKRKTKTEKETKRKAKIREEASCTKVGGGNGKEGAEDAEELTREHEKNLAKTPPNMEPPGGKQSKQNNVTKQKLFQSSSLPAHCCSVCLICVVGFYDLLHSSRSGIGVPSNSIGVKQGVM